MNRKCKKCGAELPYKTDMCYQCGTYNGKKPLYAVNWSNLFLGIIWIIVAIVCFVIVYSLKG